MTRFVIGPDVALYLAQSQTEVPAQQQLLAPTLIRSQVLAPARIRQVGLMIASRQAGPFALDIRRISLT